MSPNAWRIFDCPPFPSGCLVGQSAPSGNARAEGAPFRLAQGFRAFVYEEMGSYAFGTVTEPDQVVEKSMHDGGVLGRVLDCDPAQTRTACFSTHVRWHLSPVLVALAWPVDLDRDQIKMREVGRHPFVVPGLRQGLVRRDTADLDNPAERFDWDSGHGKPHGTAEHDKLAVARSEIPTQTDFAPSGNQQNGGFGWALVTFYLRVDWMRISPLGFITPTSVLCTAVTALLVAALSAPAIYTGMRNP